MELSPLASVVKVRSYVEALSDREFDEWKTMLLKTLDKTSEKEFYLTAITTMVNKFNEDTWRSLHDQTLAMATILKTKPQQSSFPEKCRRSIPDDMKIKIGQYLSTYDSTNLGYTCRSNFILTNTKTYVINTRTPSSKMVMTHTQVERLCLTNASGYQSRFHHDLKVSDYDNNEYYEHLINSEFLASTIPRLTSLELNVRMLDKLPAKQIFCNQADMNSLKLNFDFNCPDLLENLVEKFIHVGDKRKIKQLNVHYSQYRKNRYWGTHFKKQTVQKTSALIHVIITHAQSESLRLSNIRSMIINEKATFDALFRGTIQEFHLDCTTITVLESLIPDSAHNVNWSVKSLIIGCKMQGLDEFVLRCVKLMEQKVFSAVVHLKFVFHDIVARAGCLDQLDPSVDEAITALIWKRGKELPNLECVSFVYREFQNARISAFVLDFLIQFRKRIFKRFVKLRCLELKLESVIEDDSANKVSDDIVDRYGICGLLCEVGRIKLDRQKNQVSVTEKISTKSLGQLIGSVKDWLANAEQFDNPRTLTIFLQRDSSDSSESSDSSDSSESSDSSDSSESSDSSDSSE